LIIPDLPLSIYKSQYRELFEQYQIPNVFLVTPQTSEERIREIDDLTNSFIYAVSSASTTGTKGDFASAEEYLQRLKNLNLKNPVLTGFNIKTRQDFETACKYVDGAIIGSEFIRQISNAENLEEKVTQFVHSIKTK
jgi:tryptophan synthase alpha chain